MAWIQWFSAYLDGSVYPEGGVEEDVVHQVSEELHPRGEVVEVLG